MVTTIKTLARRAKERFAGAGASVRAIFDPAYYLRRYSDVAASGVDPLTHFESVGWAEGRNPCALFDTEHYLAQNPDVAEAGVNPLLHYIKQGAREGRIVSPLFHADWYLQQNPDVAEAGVNPLLHYLTRGAAEGREANPLFDSGWYLARHPHAAKEASCALAHYAEFGVSQGLSPHPLFDGPWYLQHHGDVAAAGLNPLAHFLLRGHEETRQPHPLFDAAWYRAGCPDAAGRNPLLHYLSEGAARGYNPNPLFDGAWYHSQHPQAAGANPLVHYVTEGAAAGLPPHPLFSGRWYLEQYPDVAAAGTNPLAHYLERGAFEARQPHPLFDAVWYRETYPDVVEAGVNPLIHYLETGWREGRNPSPDFDGDEYLKSHPEAAVSGPLPHFALSERGKSASGAAPVSKDAATKRVKRASDRDIIAPFFDEEFYRRTNPDLRAETDLLGHFLASGWQERRDPSPAFSVEYYLAAHPDVKREKKNPFVHYHEAGKLEGRATMRSAIKPPRVGLVTSAAPKLAVLAMVKNEIDIIESFVAHVLALFDVIVIIDHGSTDGTREYLQEVAARYPAVALYDLKEPGYAQALTMNFMASECPELRGVDWLFLLDADEFLPFESRHALSAAMRTVSDSTVVYMNWRNVAPAAYWEDQVDLSDHPLVIWPEAPSPYRKIAFQPSLLRERKWWIDQGNHALLSQRHGDPLPSAPAGFDLIHLPVRSKTQLALKLNQGALSYRQLGQNRDQSQGSHWFRILEWLRDKELTSDLLNGVVAHYGEETPLAPLPTEALLARNASMRPLRIALEAPNAPKPANKEAADLLFRLSGDAATSGAQRTKPPERLEFHGHEIHAASDGNRYGNLPETTPAAQTATNDVRFLADVLRPSYWDIAHATPSAWTGHIPFMFCLTTLMRPRRFVELGSHYGASFFAYCQAAKRAGLSTEAIAVDCWEGDDHAGFYDTSVFDQFRFILKNYEDIASYLRMYFSEAAQLFDKGSVDLLHIDGLHTYEAVREDFETWLPKMSDRGVILFHDIAVHERDFGVWRFWKELKARYPSMEFRHNHGLGVIYVGTSGTSGIERLIQLFASDEIQDLLQQHFEEIGQKSADLDAKRRELQHRDAQAQAAGAAAEDLTRVKQEASVLRSEREQLLQLLRRDAAET